MLIFSRIVGFYFTVFNNYIFSKHGCVCVYEPIVVVITYVVQLHALPTIKPAEPD